MDYQSNNKKQKKSVVVPPKKCIDTCKHCSNECNEKIKETDTFEEAVNKWFLNIETNGEDTESIPLKDSLKRISGEEFYSKINVPMTDCAMHDGIAVNYEICQKRFESGNKILQKEEFSHAPMGSCFSEKFDTILHAEQCIINDNGTASILGLPRKYQSVKLKGTYISKGEKIINKNEVLTPSILALLQYSGCTYLNVKKKPRVSIIVVGNDLKAPGMIPNSGEYIECNSIYISSTVELSGGVVTNIQIIEDNEKVIECCISNEVKNCDILVTVGGVGKGEENYEDYTVKAIRNLGEITSYGVSLDPGGKNLILGKVDEKPIIGMPGPPHACIIMTDYFIPIIVEKLLGISSFEYLTVDAEIEEDFPKRGGGTSIWNPRVNLKYIDGKYKVSLVSNMGETVDAFVEASGFVKVTGNLENYKKGKVVEVNLLKPKKLIK